MWLVGGLYDKVELTVFRLSMDGHKTIPAIDNVEWLDSYKKRLTQPSPFPGYVFIELTDRWRSAAQVWGVKLLVYERSGKFAPHTISDEKMAEIIAYAPERESGDECEFVKGDFLRIKAGKFCGFFATFKRPNHGRATLDIDFMGRTMEVSLSLHQLELAARPHGASTVGKKPARSTVRSLSEI